MKQPDQNDVSTPLGLLRDSFAEEQSWHQQADSLQTF